MVAWVWFREENINKDVQYVISVVHVVEQKQ